MKRHTLIDLKAEKQEAVYNGYSQLIDKYLRENKINLVLYERKIQSMEGALILNIAKSLDIKVICPHFGRIYGRSFFSNSEQEEFKTPNAPLASDIIKAKEFVSNFLEKESFLYPLYKKTKFSQKYYRNFFYRLYSYIYRHIVYVEMFEKIDFFHSIKNNIPFLNIIKETINKSRAKKHYSHILKKHHLPENYVYFPLHFYPEASIAVHAPYFKDQIRAIDLIRLNMPKNYKLIVKEHPSMYGKRNISFYKQLNKMAGVRLVSHKFNTIKLIKKSKLTITITGTAALEAFLLKVPSFTLAKPFFSEFVNTIDIDFFDFKSTIKNYLVKTIESQEVENVIAKIYANTNEYTPRGFESNPELILSESNLNNFINGVIHFYENHEMITQPELI